MLTADEIARLDEASALMDATRQTFLDELYAHGRAHDEQREDRLQRLRNVEPETAELLGVLVRAMSATRVLEIGTSNGYSTIWLGDAAEAVGGTVLVLEIEAERTAPGARQPRRRPASTRSSSCARRTPPRRCAAFADGAFDLIFLDAERPHYAGYWPDLIRVLRAAACSSSTTRSRTPRSSSSSPSSSTPPRASPRRW